MRKWGNTATRITWETQLRPEYRRDHDRSGPLSRGTPGTFLHFKHTTCAARGEEEERENQEVAGNESNSCITSNTPSSKLHNIKNQAHSESSTSKTPPASRGRRRAGGAVPSLRGSARTHPPLHPFVFFSSLAVVLWVFVIVESSAASWVRGGSGGNARFPPSERADGWWLYPDRRRPRWPPPATVITIINIIPTAVIFSRNSSIISPLTTRMND